MHEFVGKLYQLVQSESTLIQWNALGNAFCVENPMEFETKILKGNKVVPHYMAFQRLLQYFGFKCQSQRGCDEYYHASFMKDGKQYLHLVVPKERTAAFSNHKTALDEYAAISTNGKRPRMTMEALQVPHFQERNIVLPPLQHTFTKLQHAKMERSHSCSSNKVNKLQLPRQRCFSEVYATNRNVSEIKLPSVGRNTPKAFINSAFEGTRVAGSSAPPAFMNSDYRKESFAQRKAPSRWMHTEQKYVSDQVRHNTDYPRMGEQTVKLEQPIKSERALQRSEMVQSDPMEPHWLNRGNQYNHEFHFINVGHDANLHSTERNVKDELCVSVPQEPLPWRISKRIHQTKLRMENKHEVPAFLSSLYDMLDTAKFNDIIAWANDGHAFQVLDYLEFQSKVLPMYFRHCNFHSFHRQLNMYGFRKFLQVGKSYRAYFHPNFRQHHYHHLHTIKRKPCTNASTRK